LRAKYVFDATLPEEVRVITDPRTDTVDNKHFRYAFTSAFRGNAFKGSIDLSILAERVDPAELQKYGEDLRAVSNIPAGVIVISKNAIKVAGPARKAKKDFAKVLRDRLQENIEKTTQTIKSGKLTGNDLAATYCLRATSRSHLGAFSAAIADANEAVKLSTDTLGCRAHVYFNAGEFDKSVGDYSQAIALGATEPRSFHLRGISKFYAGKLEEAADDLTKANSTDDKEGQVYSDLWLAWTLRRLGKPLPEQLLTRAKNQAHGDWPRPALALITGDITPREMMELIERKSGDDRTMALAEGYFYLGQYYLGRGDKAKAGDSFRRARGQNVVMYMEHSASGFELERLGHDGPVSTSSITSGADTITENAPEKRFMRGAPAANRKTTHKPAAQGPEDWRGGLWR
jgi:lipoprotein NlpI